jgi:hypothetical protein
MVWRHASLRLPDSTNSVSTKWQALRCVDLLGSAKGERKGFHTYIEKLNFKLPIRDGSRLSDQLIHPWFRDCPVALFVHINAVNDLRRLSIDQDPKSY